MAGTSLPVTASKIKLNRVNDTITYSIYIQITFIKQTTQTDEKIREKPLICE